jgi:hypothetical protein
LKQFFKHTDTEFSRNGKRCLKVTKASGRLAQFVPFPVLIVIDKPTAKDVTNLYELANQVDINKKHAGILIYREPPDTIFRIRMAEVRLRDNFVLIPIPFQAIEQAIVDSAVCSGLLAQYCERYLPGSNSI